MAWQCTHCGLEFERLWIHWGTVGGEKVDIIDYFCPNPSCGTSDDFVFHGTTSEQDEYWSKEWFGKFGNEEDPK